MPITDQLEVKLGSATGEATAILVPDAEGDPHTEPKERLPQQTPTTGYRNNAPEEVSISNSALPAVVRESGDGATTTNDESTTSELSEFASTSIFYGAFTFNDAKNTNRCFSCYASLSFDGPETFNGTISFIGAGIPSTASPISGDATVEDKEVPFKGALISDIIPTVLDVSTFKRVLLDDNDSTSNQGSTTNGELVANVATDESTSSKIKAMKNKTMLHQLSTRAFLRLDSPRTAVVYGMGPIPEEGEHNFEDVIPTKDGGAGISLADGRSMSSTSGTGHNKESEGQSLADAMTLIESSGATIVNVLPNIPTLEDERTPKVGTATCAVGGNEYMDLAMLGPEHSRANFVLRSNSDTNKDENTTPAMGERNDSGTKVLGYLNPRALPFYPSRRVYLEPSYPEEYHPLQCMLEEDFPLPVSTELGIPACFPACVRRNGVISMRMGNLIYVDLTIDKAIRVTHVDSDIVLVMGASGKNMVLKHHNGCVWQWGSMVEAATNEPASYEKYVKMTHKGITFASAKCPLVYKLDSAGARSTHDTFTTMDQYSFNHGFYEESRHGPAHVEEATRLLKAFKHWKNKIGESNWLVNGVHITQTDDGLVRVSRKNNNWRMYVSPNNGTANITMPNFHCSASMGDERHLSVRFGDYRLHYDGINFVVRNGNYSAGFDQHNNISVF